MSNNSLKNRKGILLLEVIMSVAVVMTALLLLTRAYHTCRMVSQRSDEMMDAAVTLDALLSPYGDGIDVGASQGLLEGSTFERWRMEVTPLPETLLNQVTATVELTDDPSVSYRIHTYLMDASQVNNA